MDRAVSAGSGGRVGVQLLFDEADALIGSGNRKEDHLERAVFVEMNTVTDDYDDDVEEAGRSSPTEDEDEEEGDPEAKIEASDADKATLLRLCEHAVYVTATPGAILLSVADSTSYGTATLPIHRHQKIGGIVLPYFGFTKKIGNSLEDEQFYVSHAETEQPVIEHGRDRLDRDPGIVQVCISSTG